VAELGYVFRDDPWKNLDFFTPQSGDAGLLDVFCIRDDDRTDALIAGKVDINTRQQPVLQAIVSGAYKDELNYSSSSIAGSAEASNIASALIARTSDTSTADKSKGPLRNISELIGKPIVGYTSDPYYNYYTNSAGIEGVGYDGFVNDLNTYVSATASTSVYSDGGNYGPTSNIQRLRESAIRALADAGTARVWDLMIDVVAQTGHYPPSATTLDNFYVDGEQHYWVHVAIDRYTGHVIDENVEPVKD
jgi:hypothetical protein